MNDEPRLDIRQPVRLTAVKQREWPDIGNLIGQIERIHISRRELTVWWADQGVRINLGFDDVEVVA